MASPSRYPGDPATPATVVTSRASTTMRRTVWASFSATYSISLSEGVLQPATPCGLSNLAVVVFPSTLPAVLAPANVYTK